MAWLMVFHFAHILVDTALMAFAMRAVWNLPVGARGFEPPTSRTRTVRAAELRYAPSLTKGIIHGVGVLAKGGVMRKT